ncbi:MAG: YegP family protein [Pyrinomonadaceae bacterium]|nr:YegP family protein [Pyrinomonadaceae bacterium]
MAAKFEIKSATNGKFYFNLVAANGQIILSSQMYETKASAEIGIDSVKTNGTNDEQFERRKSTNGEPYFVLKAQNGLEIGKSQMYQSTDGLENGINSVKSNAATAEIVDTTSA